MNTKTLIVGADYSAACGRPNGSIIYIGGSSWRLSEGTRTAEVVDERMTQVLTEYVNRPSISMGSVTRR